MSRTQTKSLWIIVALVALAAGELRAATPAGQPAAADQEKALIAVLQSDAAPAEKAVACKRLALCGSKNAVPALTPLLSDEKLASWARIALEALPDRAADDALLAAAAKLQGRLAIGAINSIGVRRDVQASAALAEKLKDADVEVASAAAVALGRIGGPAAGKTLDQALANCSSELRPAVAEGCIVFAERLLAEGQAAEAVKFYDAVRAAAVPKQRIVEATRGAILARKSAGVPMLAELWKSDDKAMFAIGLSVAREVAGREVTDALVAELGRAPPERQALLILVLADRGDAAALPAVLQAAKNGPELVRNAAVRVLGRLGDASCVPMLLEAAMDANAPLAQTALAVLTDMPGKQVDDDLSARLGKAEGKARQVLIQLVGRRAIAAAVPALRKAADDPDAQIRLAALAALGSTITAADLPLLTARVAELQNADEAAAATKALSAACQRMPDAEACAEKLIAAMGPASVAAKCRFLEVLSAVGGKKALAAVGAAAKDPSAEIQEEASRLLGAWMSVDAGPVLLDLAKTASADKYKVRALRGYIRLARQFAMPDAQRLEMCRVALAAAERDTEKRLVLEVLERNPSLDTLRLAVEIGKTPSLKNEAGSVALIIVQKSGVSSAEAQQLLTQIGQEPVKIEIVKAVYGEGAKVKDVTDALRKHARNVPVIVLPSANYNSAFGGDPAPGVPKQLKIEYRINDKPATATFAENATILLPVPK
jgi:HEAT repeat protein